MVSAGDLQQRYGGAQDNMSSKRASPGLLIGCTIDAASGLLSFSVNGKEVANKFQVRFHCYFLYLVFCSSWFYMNRKFLLHLPNESFQGFSMEVGKTQI